METILLNPETITPRFIKQLRERFNISWSDLHRACNYDARGNALYNAVRDPDKYLTPLMRKKIVAGIAKLEKQKGHVFDMLLTNGAKRPPKHFAIAGNPRVCLGHKRATYELPKDGFCDAECKAIYSRRKKK